MSEIGAFRNRLLKSTRHWRKWARRREISCYRIYTRDIPEFPWIIDWYDGRAHAQWLARGDGLTETQLEQQSAVICEVLEIPPEALAIKLRQRQKGAAQYEKTGHAGEDFVVQEQGLKFWVNLDRYLDTGLFLDHRLTRQRVREEAAGKRLLNLFAYTGSFTVYGAAGGARESITVDLSNTYQAWSLRNFELNRMDSETHQLVRADVMEYLAFASRQRMLFDLIVMDPPSFSNSKKMAEVLDVQRDHAQLIQHCLSILRPSGKLYFSTNLRSFKLDRSLEEMASVCEITAQTVPEDFKRVRPHRCWEITHTQ